MNVSQCSISLTNPYIRSGHLSNGILIIYKYFIVTYYKIIVHHILYNINQTPVYFPISEIIIF